MGWEERLRGIRTPLCLGVPEPEAGIAFRGSSVFRVPRVTAQEGALGAGKTKLL